VTAAAVFRLRQTQDVVDAVQDVVGLHRLHRRFGGVTPGAGGARQADAAGGLDVAGLVADAQHLIERRLGGAGHGFQLPRLAEHRGAAAELADVLGERAQGLADIGLGVGADDGQLDALLSQGRQHLRHAGHQVDFGLGIDGAQVLGDFRQVPDAHPQHAHALARAHVAQLLNLRRVDGAEAELARDVVEDAFHPRPAVGQHAVEIEDDQLDRHASLLACPRLRR
jgi:hypothetical protein